MRNSNSKDKAPIATTSYQQNRLMKTQVPPKGNAKQSLNATQYKAPTNKRIQSSKNTSASTSNKQIPRQQVDYDIQKNMTQSKIFTAKQSLQLLKKKMNRTGMSREKPAGNNQNMQKTKYAPQSMKKIKSQTTKNIEYNQPVSTKYQDYDREDYEPPSKKLPSKKVIEQKAPQKKQIPAHQTYQNQNEQIPISKNQNFQAILQRQLKKEQNMRRNTGNVQGNNKFENNQPQFDQDQYGDQGELFQCGKGCGRQFNQKVLARHQKVCEKVFQSKRKVFNTAAQRQLQVEGFQQATQYGKTANKNNQTKKPVQQKNKVPKWKLQSAQLRAGLKAVSNQPLTAQQQRLNNMQKDSLVQCSHCGRKFNQQAAIRHISFCQKKAKQMSRPSNGRKK